MSDHYRSLTRTYRPTSFQDIVSQEHVSSTLQNAIEKQRLAHAYMFCGPRGVGKTTMARVLARTVNDIEQDVDGESLNQTLNVIEIDAASNNSVSDIRDLREKVRVPPQSGRYKIYIIDEVHMLSKSAFNALLKTLEEPPDHIIFIFATTEPHKVLPTILSRVQRFDFKRISVGQIVDRLKQVANDQDITIDEDSLHVIAKKADGALRDALGLMDQAIAFCGKEIAHEELLQALNVVSTERMFEFMETVEQKDAGKGLHLINDLLQEGYDIQEYLVGLTEHLRNLYVAAGSAKMHLVEATDKMKERYKKSAQAFSEDDLMRMLHIVSEAQFKLKEAHQPKIQFEITLLKLIHMERSENINELLAGLDKLKKKDEQQLNQPKETNSSQSVQTDSQPQNGDVSSKEQDTESAGEQESQDNTEAPTQSADPINDEADESQKTSETENAKAVDDNSDSVAEQAVSNGTESSRENPDAGNKQPNSSYENLFGKSSLETAVASTDTSTQTEDTKAEEETSVPRRAPKDLSMEEIKSEWPEYVAELRHHVPQMLYLQMQRVEPIELKNGSLILRCNNDFEKKIVGENNRKLGKLLQDEIGAFLSFSCVVQKDDSAPEEKKQSPYERFKDLQERDPTIKKLVELFGAELDYNLDH